MDMSIENADLAMKVQISLQRKLLDFQAGNVMKLVESVTGGEDKSKKSINQSSGAGRLNILA